MSVKEPSRFIPALSFDWLTPAYDTVVRYTTREKVFKSALLHQMAPQAGERILDLGCGTGTLAVMIKSREPRAEVIGFDADARILERARRKARENQVDIVFNEGLSNQLPYADATFDCVVSSLFFHHLLPHNKLSTLKEVKRILRKNGRLRVADWSTATNHLMKLLSRSISLLDGVETTRDSFEGKLRKYINDGGFKNVSEVDTFNTIFGTIRLINASR